MSLKATEDYSLHKTQLLELYLRNLGANLLGFFIIILLNFFTPLKFFKIQRAALPGSIAGVVTDVNRQLAHDVEESGGFITLFYLVVDVTAGYLNWVRAGHDPAILYDPETDSFEDLRGEGVALGVNADARYREYRKEDLKKGQIIVLGTDGLWEARNPDGEMFGKDPLYDIIRSKPAAGAKEILNTCFDTFNRFLRTRAPEDDVTLVVIKITGDRL
jgi:sigma-B regulation protein RsbU (phosphoserine phosphatase)